MNDFGDSKWGNRTINKGKRLRYCPNKSFITLFSRGNSLGFLIDQRLNGSVIDQPRSPAMNTQDQSHRRLPRPHRRHSSQVGTRLQQLADDHFGHDPDAIHWDHVGDLGRVESALETRSPSSMASAND